MARQKGASEALVEAVQDRGRRADVEQLEPAWRAALDYADVVHQTGHKVSDELYARLAATWNPGQIIEITLVVGMAEYFNRFNDALRVQPTK